MRFAVLVSLVAVSAHAAALEDEMWARAAQTATTFKARTGVTMEWLPGDASKPQPLADGIVVWPPTALDLEAALPALLAELSIYPDRFLGNAGLKRLLLTRGLERGGKAWGGLAFPAGPLRGTLIVSLRSVRHAAVALHHEVFHLAQVVSAVLSRRAEWRACNPQGFVYAEEGAVDRSVRRGAVVTDYAGTNLIEDQAEVFAWGVSDAAFLETHAAADEAIACKAKLVRAFARQVDAGFDDERWARLKTRRLGEPF